MRKKKKRILRQTRQIQYEVLLLTFPFLVTDSRSRQKITTDVVNLSNIIKLF